MAKSPRGKSTSANVGGYRIEQQIGRGGMGVVFLATHMALDKRVALKVIAEELAEDEGFRERFRREPKLAASIDHPNVIPVFDAGEDEDQLFVAMRYVDGSDLRTVIASEGRLEPVRAARIVAQVADALDAAHELGLVHRDVKPANVLIENRRGEEHVYLTDFGLTKGGEGSAALTKTGQWVGTPDYVAPEQIHGGVLDRRTDIYALGGVLYHTLAGHPPYGRETEVAKIYAHLSKPPPELPDDIDASPELRAVIRRAMAKEPADRYASAGELGREAVAAATGEHPRLSSETASFTSPPAPETALAPEPGATKAAAGSTAAAAPGETKLAPGETALAGAGATAPAAAGATAAATGRAGPTAGPTAAPAPATARTEEPSQVTEALRRGTRGHPMYAALIPLAIVILAGIGFALGNSGGGTESPSFSNSASAGTTEVSFPNSWNRTTSPVNVPGIDFKNPVSVVPGGGPAGTGLVVGQVDAGGPSLLPAQFGQLVGGDPPRDDAVKLGAADGYRYADLKPSGYDGTLTVFTVPTSAGVATIACALPTGTSSSVSDQCEQIAGTLSLNVVKTYSLGPDSSYASTVSKSISGLNDARASKLKSLRAAKTPGDQAKFLNDLAGAYGNAAKPLAGAEVSPADQPANGAIVAAIKAGQNAYAAMSAAARANSDSAYSRGKAAVGKADADLQAALKQLTALGYQVS